jgi:hypothetical protein
MECFAQRLHEQTGGSAWGRSKLAGALFFELSLLLGVPLLVIFVPKYHPLWSPPGGSAIVTLIKLTSIGLLFLHIIRSAPTLAYKCIGVLMVPVALLVGLYALITAGVCSPWEGLCEWVQSHSLLALYGVSIASFWYMPIFWIANHFYMRSDQDNLGLTRFCQAFIYGVNAPSLIAFAAVLLIPLFNPDEPPKTFVSGAVAFLVFYSTAAILCVDYYAQPFLQSGGGKCVLPPPLSATAGS